MSDVTDATSEPDAPVEDKAAFSMLDFEVLVSIAALLMPSVDKGFVTVPDAWRDAVHFIAASSVTHAVMLEAMRERFQIRGDICPGALCALVHSLLVGGGAAKWKAVRPLRAIRVQTPHSMPMQTPPRLSGGSLCTLAPRQLCLFGGRDSASGDTLSATRLITLRSAVAIWDECQCDPHPPARCYHTAVVWKDAPCARTELPPMVVFGGAILQGSVQGPLVRVAQGPLVLDAAGTRWVYDPAVVPRLPDSYDRVEFPSPPEEPMVCSLPAV